ncbi:MAG: hypothetical protein ACQES9_03380 [Myxococcota bacterium]
MAKKKQKRRSISVKGHIYDKVKKYSKEHKISMSAFIEDRIQNFFEGKEDKAEPATQNSEPKKAKKKANQKSTPDIAAHEKQVNPPPRKRKTEKQINNLSDKEFKKIVKQHFTF